MSVRQRLKHLERKAVLQPGSPDPYADWLSESDWLERFEQWGQEGMFAGEPDFPLALATYRQALEQAITQADPPFDSPADFMPNQAEPLRRVNWQDRFRFPEIDQAWTWLAEMMERVAKGGPPVTEEEFRELAAWFHGQEDRLRQQECHALLELGNGRKNTCANLRYGLWQGPRALGVTEVVEDLRQLRKRSDWGDGSTS